MSRTVERLWEKAYRTAQSGARSRGLEFKLTLSQFKELTEMRCTYCGEDASGFDRMNNRIGYTLANTTPCCMRCNRIKANRHDVLYMFNRIEHALLGRAGDNFESESA